MNLKCIMGVTTCSIAYTWHNSDFKIHFPLFITSFVSLSFIYFDAVFFIFYISLHFFFSFLSFIYLDTMMMCVICLSHLILSHFIWAMLSDTGTNGTHSHDKSLLLGIFHLARFLNFEMANTMDFWVYISSHKQRPIHFSFLLSFFWRKSESFIISFHFLVHPYPTSSYCFQNVVSCRFYVFSFFVSYFF